MKKGKIFTILDDYTFWIYYLIFWYDLPHTVHQYDFFPENKRVRIKSPQVLHVYHDHLILCKFIFLFSVTEKFSESLHIVANEPSLAFFRIQEHVRKSLPTLVEKKVIFFISMSFLLSSQNIFIIVCL